MNNIKTVVSFEFLGFIKKRSNWITLIIVSIFSLIIAILPHIKNLISDNSSDDNIYLYFENTAPLQIDNNMFTVIDNRDKLLEMVSQEVIDEFYTIDDDTITLYTTKSNNLYETDKAFKSNFMDLYISEIITDEQFLNSYNKILNTLDNIERKEIILNDSGYYISDSSEENFYSRFIIGYFLLMVTYITMSQFSSYASISVANEKTSRTMESLIYITDTNSLIIGKVLGVFLGGMVQVFFMILSLLLGLYCSITFSPNSTLEITPGFIDIFNNITLKYILFYAICCSFAFLNNLFIYASLASTVTKIEELPSTLSLGSFISVISFFIAIAIFTTPPNVFLNIAPYFPLFTPLAMLAKFSVGTITTFDIIYTLIVSTITICLIAILASKIYKIGVLFYGTKLNHKQLIKEIFKK